MRAGRPRVPRVKELIIMHAFNYGKRDTWTIHTHTGNVVFVVFFISIHYLYPITIIIRSKLYTYTKSVKYLHIMHILKML